MTHPIPDTALDDRIAFIGAAGSGKTYAAGTAVERALAQNWRVVIVDPLGVWWGLRLGADGARAGFPVVIFGGAHGDLPLVESAGALIGETAATMAESAVVDLSALGTKAAERRFMLSFLTAIYRKTAGAPLLVVLDEADMWAPQQIRDRDGDAARLLGMMETLVRRGRVKGFIPWLITQRPAVLNKDVLSQVDGLVAMKLPSPQDRAALKNWVDGAADAAVLKGLNADLPGLQKGEGVVWIPGRDVFERARFPSKRTFDSSATPKRGERRRGSELAPLDLGALKDRLAAVETEAKANDPASLKAEIAKLKRDAAEAAKAAKNIPVSTPDDIKAAERRAYNDGWSAGADAAGKLIAKHLAELAVDQRSRAENIAALHAGELTAFIKALPETLADAALVSGPGSDKPSGGVTKGLTRLTGTGFASDSNASKRRPTDATATSLGAERRPLQILVDRAPAAFTEAQWATLAGMKRTGGTWAAYKSRLRSAGLVVQDGGLWRASAQALETMERREPEGSALDQWRTALGGGPAKLIDILENAAAPVSREDLAVAAGMTASGGTFAAYLSRLKSNGVIEKSDRGFSLSEVLR